MTPEQRTALVNQLIEHLKEAAYVYTQLLDNATSETDRSNWHIDAENTARALCYAAVYNA